MSVNANGYDKNVKPPLHGCDKISACAPESNAAVWLRVDSETSKLNVFRRTVRKEKAYTDRSSSVVVYINMVIMYSQMIVTAASRRR